MADNLSSITPPNSPAEAPPPQSPSNRRQQKRSGDESWGIIPINEYLYRLDDYRVAFPNIPPALGLLSSPLTPEEAPLQALFRNLESSIIAILAKYEVAWSTLSIDNKFRRPQDPKIPTVTILVPGDCPERWGNVAQEVHALFRDCDLSQVQIEVINPRRAHFVQLLGVPFGHPSAAQFNRVQHHISDVVDYHAGSSWAAIGLYNCVPGSSWGHWATGKS